MIKIVNDGPLLVSTNYWDTDAAKHGKFYLTTNAGAFRLLIPPSIEKQALPEMKTGKMIIITRGAWPDEGKDDGLEIMFDDKSANPFCLHLAIESADRLPLDSDAGRKLEFTAWVKRGRATSMALQLPCYYRREATIPCLKPWKEN